MLLISLALAIGGILLALYMYLIDTALPERLSARWPWAYRVLLGKYFVDELYDRWVVGPVKRVSDWLWAEVDVVRRDSAWLSRVQSGFVRNYALSIFLGAVIVIGYLIIR